jgi:hypothetical protein
MNPRSGVLAERASIASRIDHAGPPRSIMNDDRISDRCLIDFSDSDLEALLEKDLEPALGKALRHVLASAHDSAYSSFNASIV